MALLSTSVTASSVGHDADHNQAHRKLNQLWIDVVADFGADNTGSTSASAALQAAIDEAEDNRSGVGVYLPPGTYRSTVTLLVTKPGLSLIGSGWNTVLSVPNATNIAAVIQFSPPGSVRMEGLHLAHMKIDCNGSNQTTAGRGIDADGACYCLFEHLQIREPWRNGIELHGDGLGGFGHHNVVRDCWIHRGSASSGGEGRAVEIYSSDENKIENNTFEACGTNLANAAAVRDTASLNHYIGNTWVADPNKASVEQLVVPGDCMIVGNIFDGGTNSQLRITGNANTVSNNSFYKVEAGAYGIRVTGGKNTFTANAFRSHPTASTSGGAINAASASLANYGTGNVVETMGAWASTIFAGTSAELTVPTAVGH